MNPAWKRRGLALCLTLMLVGLTAMAWVGHDGSGWRGFIAAGSASAGTVGMALLLLVRAEPNPNRMDRE